MEISLADRFPFRVETREGRGRCVIATRDLPAGETVLVSAPAASLPFLGSGACHFCASRPTGGKSLSKCGGCKTAAYCGKQCQAGDWKRDHKLECKAWGNVSTLPDVGGTVTHAILAGRVLRGSRLRPAGVDAWAEDSAPGAYQHSLADCLGMECDANPMRGPGDAISVEIARTNGLLPPDVTDEAVSRLVSAFDRNNFSITDELMGSTAAGVYPAGALLNHACAPNCSLSYVDYVLPHGASEEEHARAGAAAARGTHLQVVRTLAPVAAGDELTHSYVEIARPRWERRRALRLTYGFTCACELCALPEDEPRCGDSHFERRVDGGRLPGYLHGTYGPSDPSGGVQGDLPDDMEPSAVQAVKSARVLVCAVEAGPPPASPPRSRVGAPSPVYLEEPLLARVAYVNAQALAGLPGAPSPSEGPSEVVTGASQDGKSSGGAMRRYRATRGAVTSLADSDAACVRLELTALEASLGLLGAGGAHPLHLDVFACASLAWSRYLLLEDSPLAIVAGEAMADFYASAYSLCPAHPMAGLHLFTLADTLASLVRVAAQLGRSGTGRAPPTLIPVDRAQGLRGMYRTPGAARAIAMLSQPLGPAATEALRLRATACYDACAASLGLWLGAGHPMPAKARALAAELRADARAS